MNKKRILILALMGALLTGSAFAMEKPVTIADQGSFMAGGTIVEKDGKTLHGDHAYVFYQKPVKAHKYGLVFLHGAGQSGKTWETTPDGRDGFQNIFLERGYATYVVDQPRRGKAGLSTVPGKYEPAYADQMWYNIGRTGEYPNAFPGVQAPIENGALDQSFRFGTPNVADFDAEVISDAMAVVFEKSGDGIFVTHSQGGGIGWLTAMKSSHVKGIISLEPGSGFLFPEGEVPETMVSSSPFGNLSGTAIPKEEFEKLTKMPILLIYGDNIPSGDQPVPQWGQDNWRVRLNMARLWVEAVNRHGGNAQLIHLPEIGIYGNTHSLMSDMNNVDVANVMEKWIKEQKLGS